MGESVSEGTSSDLRYLINYLLVATFEYLGQDTGKAVRVRLMNVNPRTPRDGHEKMHFYLNLCML